MVIAPANAKLNKRQRIFFAPLPYARKAAAGQSKTSRESIKNSWQDRDANKSKA
jgi:hypothetical protein